MSTYNGEKYIRKQIDSILAQEGVYVELFIRDDGSLDSTRGIIADYVKRYSNIHADYGENFGIGKSFFHALLTAPEYEYYAFSDQDDYWKPEKLSSAVRQIASCANSTLPVLYYSDLNISDSSLNFIHKSKLEKRIHSLQSAIMRRSIAGCTMLMNSAARKFISLHPVTSDMLLYNHDSLIVSLIYASGGIVLYDPHAYASYRQHGNNSGGSPLDVMGRVRKEWCYLTLNPGKEARIARAILDAWDGEIVPEARPILETVAGYRENFSSRMKMVFSPEFKTGDWRLTLLGKVKALFGLL